MQRPRFLLHAVRILDEVLFWPVLALVVWGELVWRSGSGGWFDFLAGIDDKILHLLVYFALGAMAAAGVRTRRAVFFAGLGLIVLGAVLELFQEQAGRDKSVYDAFANMAGVVLGAVAARFIVEPLRKRYPYS